MNKFNSLTLSTIIGVVALSLASQASAASIRVKCETRGDLRSKISVDGGNLPAGSYSASVVSGGAQVTSQPQVADGDEVESDFDSNANDIADGATAISRTFIQGKTVSAKILNASGATVASDTQACKAKR